MNSDIQVQSCSPLSGPCLSPYLVHHTPKNILPTFEGLESSPEPQAVSLSILPHSQDPGLSLSLSLQTAAHFLSGTPLICSSPASPLFIPGLLTRPFPPGGSSILIKSVGFIQSQVDLTSVSVTVGPSFLLSEMELITIIELL